MPLQKYDYTNVDYDDLLSDIIEHFRDDEDSPLKDYNFESSNLQELMKILTYVTHLSLFHTSIALNEMYFSTARLRKNLLKQLAAYGYTPRRKTASRKNLTIINSSSSTITIPAFTAFNATGSETSDDKIFYNLTAYIIPANDSEIITVYQSSSPNGRVQTSFELNINGSIVDDVELEIPNLSEDYFVVQTTESSLTVSWVQYENLDTFQNQLSTEGYTLLPEENIYFLDETETGYKLRFSTTGIGAVPDPDDGKTLNIKYMECDGTDSNGFTTAMFSFVTPVANLRIASDSELTGLNTTGVSAGGLDKETLDELRENTIAIFNTQNRAVTTYDYTKLGKANELIGSDGDIKAYGGENHATGARLGKVYIIPKSSEASTYFFSTTQQRSIFDYFLKFSLSGITPVVQHPHYINSIIEYDYTYSILAQNTTTIKTSLNTLIKNFFVSNFGETIYIPALIELLNSQTDVDSAFIRNKFKIIFDTLTDLTGTLKLVPVQEDDIDDFINDDGSMYSGYLYGFTDTPTYMGTNYGTIKFVNKNDSYIVVEQAAGVTETNFAKFTPGAITSPAGSSYIYTRKDLNQINYEVNTNEKIIYILDTDGFFTTSEQELISYTGTAGLYSGATITSMDKASTNVKYKWIQVNSTVSSAGTQGLIVGDYITNVNGITAEIKELSGTTRIWVKYTNGSDFQEGDDVDDGTTYSAPGSYKIAKRTTLEMSTMGSGAGILGVGSSFTNIWGVTGTIETISNGTTCTIWYSNGTNFASLQNVDFGNTWQGGAGSSTFNFVIGTTTTTGTGITLGVDVSAYRVNLLDLTGSAFTLGTGNIEPGDTWGFNTIVHMDGTAGGGTTSFNVTPDLSGISVGDNLVTNNGSSVVGTVTGVTGNTVSMTTTLGFGTGDIIHSGLDWDSINYTSIYKIENVYDTSTIDSLVVDNGFYLGTGNYLVNYAGGVAQIVSLGTAASGTSTFTVYVSGASGAWGTGNNNTHQVAADTDSYIKVYDLDTSRNIETFNTNYSIEYDSTDRLRYFVNKLDATETGMLDSSPSSSDDIGYYYMFNTTEKVYEKDIKFKTQYGTQSLTQLATQQNTTYEAKLKLDSAITGLAKSMHVVCGGVSGTTYAYGYVYDISTENNIDYVTVRYDTGVWRAASAATVASGTGFNIMIGSSNSGVYTFIGSGTNYITGISYYDTKPTVIQYFTGGTTNYLGEVNLTTGNVKVKRALNINAQTIQTPVGTGVDYSNKLISFDDSSGFIDPGGTSSATISCWNTDTYEWVDYEYTDNISSGTWANKLQGTNTINSKIKEGQLAIQNTANSIERIEFDFKNKIDKLKLGNRSLFYSSTDLINPIP